MTDPAPSPPPRRALVSRLVGVATLVVVAAALVWQFAGGLGGAPTEGTDDDRVGEFAPDFTLETLGGDGETITLEDHLGDVILIDFWATYCPPCRRSMPHLQDLHDELDGESFTLLSVNVDRPAPDRDELVAGYMDAQGFDFPVLMDNGRVTWLYEATRIPLAVIVGPDRRIEYVFQGATDPRIVERAVRHVLSTVDATAQAPLEAGDAVAVSAPSPTAR